MKKSNGSFLSAETLRTRRKRGDELKALAAFPSASLKRAERPATAKMEESSLNAFSVSPRLCVKAPRAFSALSPRSLRLCGEKAAGKCFPPHPRQPAQDFRGESERSGE